MTTEAAILRQATESGAALLVGPGGSGKTYLLQRVAKLALAAKILPIRIDLAKWRDSNYKEWAEWSAPRGAGAEYLIDRFAEPRTSFLELDIIPPPTKKILLVDGLNEVTSGVSQQIIFALNEFARSQIQASVLVTDRPIRRELPGKWAIGRVLPLTRNQIRKYLPRGRPSSQSSVELLERPLYLDLFLQTPKDSIFSAARGHEVLAKRIGLKGEDLRRAAAAAFEMYKTERSRSFRLSTFEACAGSKVVRKLRRSKALEVTGDTGRFAHHLFHDSLAARHLADLGEKAWTPSNLDAISFFASSLDAVLFVLLQLPSDRADIFLAKVYDWNLYATGYALAERLPLGSGPSPEMEVVIFAMLGEKKLDRVLPTAQRASDAILISRSPYAAYFRSVSTFPQLFRAAKSLKSTVTWFLQWRDLFTRERELLVTSSPLPDLRQTDSVMGWTWANVLRRSRLTTRQQMALVKLARHAPNDTVRWRVAHVMGAFPTSRGLHALIGLIRNSSDLNVRYGAVRSLVEMGSNGTHKFRQRVFANLEKLYPTFRDNEKIVRELRDAMCVQSTAEPVGWGRDVLRAVRSFYLEAKDEGERDRWIRFSDEIRRLYAV